LRDEAALLDRIRQYDQAALAQVYDEYYDRIYHYVYRFVGQVPAAEDLTANVFLRLLSAVRSGNQPHSNLLAWLYRVAHNLVVDGFRRGPAAELELTEWLEGYEPDLTHIVEQKLQLERVRRALLDLTPAQQQVIALKFLEGLDSVEVAAILNKSEGAIDALQHRALLALREALRPPPGAGPESPAREPERAREDIPPNVAPSGSTSLAAALLSRLFGNVPPARAGRTIGAAWLLSAVCWLLAAATAPRVVGGVAAIFRGLP
jgi:RNA polymerase sigma-70 factor (ECF subfamily)